MNEGKKLKVYFKQKIEGYAEQVVNATYDNETKLKVFFNKLTLLDGYFMDTEYSKEWYLLAFQGVLNEDEDAKEFFNLTK